MSVIQYWDSEKEGYITVSTDNPLPTGGGGDGKSAYDIAVENGFEGSEVDWLDSLKGEPGQPGTDGKDAEPQFTQEQVDALLTLIEDDGDA